MTGSHLTGNRCRLDLSQIEAEAAWILPVIEFVTGHTTAGRSRRSDRHAAVRCLFLLALLTVAGCRDTGPQRVAVQGSVQFDGRPVSDGSIRFIPLEGTPGPESAAPIVDGKYELDVEGGPPAGKLRVEIRQGATIPPDMTNDNSAASQKKYQIPQNKIPPQYNESSSLSVEAVLGKSNTFDFDLKATR